MRYVDLKILTIQIENIQSHRRKIIFDFILTNEDKINYNFKLLDLTILAFATSIDAFAIGMTFAFLEVAIYQALLIIGIITFLLCLFALQIGRYLNNKFQNKALIFGGIVLILIAFKTLLEHLF